MALFTKPTIPDDRHDLATVLATVQQGVASPEHAAFVAALQPREQP